MAANKGAKLGLALSGGAALGLSHIGVLKALRDHEVPVSCVSGTSAGSVAAAFFAFGVSPEQMEELMEELSWHKLMGLSHSKLGLASNRAIGNLVERMIGNFNIEDAKIPLAIVAANIETGERVVLKKGSVITAVMASTCIPGLFEPVEMDGAKLVDGGIAENLPLSVLPELGAEIRMGVNLMHFRSKKAPGNVFDVLVNSLETMASHQNSYDKTSDILIEPNLANFTASDFKKGKELVEAGYKATAEQMMKIVELVGGRKRPKKKRTFIDFLSDIFSD